MAQALAFVRKLGAAFEEGRLSAHPLPPTIHDEALPHDTVPDYRYAVELMLSRRDSERDRLDRIESKIAPIIGGTIAALGLFIGNASSALDLAAGALYLVPLFILLRTFETYEYIDVPDPEVFVESWQRWPQTFLKSVFEGTALALATNRPTIDAKARQLNNAMRWVYAVTSVVIVIRFSEIAIQKGIVPSARSAPAVSTSVPSAGATTAARASVTSTTPTHAPVRATTRP